MLAVALLAPALAPASAHAIGITNVAAAPDDARAGAHSDFNLSFDVADAADGLRDLTVDLPTGLLGNPMATTQCAESQLGADACPADAAVGSTTTSVTALAPINLPLDVPGTVYNVRPPGNEPARLGIVLRPALGLLGKIVVIVRIRVRDEDDYGLQTIIKDLPRSQAGIPIRITGLELKLDGKLANGNSFMVNPTSCAKATTKVTATSYASSRPVTATGAFTPSDCGGEPFRPGMEIGIDQPTPDTITPHTIGLTQPADVDGRAVAHVRKAVVRLPVGTTLNPSIAPTLELCSESEFGPQGDPDVTCPAASLIGHVAFDNPLLGTVPGDVYFGRAPGDPYRLYIIGRKAGVTVKIKASVQPDDDTGQITTIFDNLPQVPFTRFSLTFNGGPRGVVVTPPGCGTYTGSITATPWSGAAAQTPTAGFQISDDGKGGCAPAETPAISGDVSSHKALDSPDTFDLDIQRDATSRRPGRLDVALPAGLVGKVDDVPQCPASKATAGACPSSTRIGSVTTVVGSGPLPITLKGTVYLGTGTSTSVARIWLDIPVKVGPIDLGTFTLGNALTLGKRDGRVHVTSALPAAFKGFPLGLRRLQLRLDRKGFALNPSGCDRRSFDVDVTAVDGTRGAASGPFQARACDELRFRPRVETSIEDPDVKAAGSQPPFQTTITKPAGDAGLRDVDVLVSAMLQANPAALSDGICPPAQLEADACPAVSKIGVASASSPLLKDKLTGPVYLADVGTPAPDEPGVELPYASVFLNAPGVALRLDGQLRLSPNAGRLEAHFTGLPDVPLTDFTLSFSGGRRDHVGPFTSAGDLCTADFGPSDARLSSQAGTEVFQKPFLDAAACRQGAIVRADISGLGTARPRGVITVAREPHSTSRLRRVTIVAPTGLRVRPDRARRGLVVRANGRRLSSKRWSVSRAGRIVVRVAGRKGAETVTATFTRGALVPTDALRRLARERMSDLSGARPVPLKLSVYTTEVRGKKAKTTIDVDGRP